MSLKKIVVFCPFWNGFEPRGGSLIRIKAYTSFLEKNAVSYRFLGSNKPSYVSPENYIPFGIAGYYKKLFLIHNILYCNRLLRIFSILLKYILLSNPSIQILKKEFDNSIVISHKDNSIGFFFFLVLKTLFIYDMHGILDIQREYKEEMTFVKKLWFEIGVKHEKMVFKHAAFINCINDNMIDFLRNNYNRKGICFLAPDGISEEFLYPATFNTELIERMANDRANKKILFFGSFKKIGGAHLLAEAFCYIVKTNPEFKLITIGNGQMLSDVLELFRKNELLDKHTHINSLSHPEIFKQMEICDLIVIPDINNPYNTMIPHIKLYDALISGKPFVVPDFDVNREILSRVPNNAVFFAPDNHSDLSRAILQASQRKRIVYNSDNKDSLEKLSYNSHARNLFEQYKAVPDFNNN